MKESHLIKNWDDVRYISWDFFGRRLHVWDKHSGNIRIEEGGNVTLMNIHSKRGRVWQGGEEMTEADSLGKLLERGYRVWINDSYWLLMPYKLKDSGVTLKYLGERVLENGNPADVLQLTFENVGVTPQNKYDVFVNKKTHHVEQWSYYAQYDDPEPRFTTPWSNWQLYGKIWLSNDRGERSLSQLAVFDKLPASIFESPAVIDLSTY